MGCNCKGKAKSKVQQDRVKAKSQARELARIRQERKLRLKTVRSK